jgi:hypothetical protein
MVIMTAVLTAASILTSEPAQRRELVRAATCRDANLFVVAGTVAERRERDVTSALQGARVAGVYTTGTTATGHAAHRLADAFDVSLVPYDRDATDQGITRRLLDEVVAPHRDRVLLIVVDGDLVAPLLHAVARDSALDSKRADDAYFAVSYLNGRATVTRCPTNSR